MICNIVMALSAVVVLLALWKEGSAAMDVWQWDCVDVRRYINARRRRRLWSFAGYAAAIIYFLSWCVAQ